MKHQFYERESIPLESCEIKYRLPKYVDLSTLFVAVPVASHLDGWSIDHRLYRRLVRLRQQGYFLPPRDPSAQWALLWPSQDA
jgi:hypothetical protein